MNLHMSEIHGVMIAELDADAESIKTTQDAAELAVNALYQGAERLIIQQQHLPTAFFDLKSGMAGDMLQKFSTYGARLAIVGDFESVESDSLKAFIRESNRVGRINFVGSVDDARKALRG